MKDRQLLIGCSLRCTSYLIIQVISTYCKLLKKGLKSKTQWFSLYNGVNNFIVKKNRNKWHFFTDIFFNNDVSFYIQVKVMISYKGINNINAVPSILV